MDNEKNLTVPYIVFESALDKADRRDKRNVVIIALLVLALIATNVGWMIAWFQDETVETEEYQVDDNIDDGEIYDKEKDEEEDKT